MKKAAPPSEISAGLKGFSQAVRLSYQTDSLIRAAAARLQSENPHWALIALGGYGRRELCPFSDLDLLVLIDSRLESGDLNDLIQQTIYPLWDLGKEASHSVRTVRQTLSDTKGDA